MKRGVYVVTGAGGFVGAAISRALCAHGCEVRGIARGSYPQLESIGVRMTRADLSDPAVDLAKLFQGAEGVFHVAAKVDMWGPYPEFFKVNVEGTRAVIEACRKAGVNKLVYTSSPSVVADGKDLCGVDERYPYPLHAMAAYPGTKAIAEQEICRANTEGVLHTLSLRPHLIFGPGDHHFVPLILERARAGRLVQVGSGKNLTDFTFIEDCTRAHLLAMEALDANPGCRGRSFFITQGEPINMWEWINDVLVRHDLPRIKKRVPAGVARVLALLFEAGSRLVPGSKPLFTRFLVAQMSTSHYFSIAAAQRELGFYPRYSMREAFDLSFPSRRDHSSRPSTERTPMNDSMKKTA